MAVTLRADNRVLVNNAKFAYLVDNYQAGAASVVVTNNEPFSTDTPILLAEMGKTDAEILKVSVLNTSTNTITIGDIDSTPTGTAFPHPESTRVIALPYDQIRFYWTAATGTISDETPTFGTANPLTGWTTLDPSSYYSTYSDVTNTTGFGWFKYRNKISLEESAVSNPIPYVGFTLNTAQQVFADFDSLLNTNELKLISIPEKFAWLNEALSQFKNKLNLSNVEYTVSTEQSISATNGTAEYILPDDFSDIVEITDSSGVPIEFIPVSQILEYAGTNPTVNKYYLRGRYIGLSPTPTASATYKYRYRGKAVRVTSLSTYIDLPDNGFYSLKDWLMFRAYSKFNNPMAASYYQYFTNSLNLQIQASVKRSANLDTWGIDSAANA